MALVAYASDTDSDFQAAEVNGRPPDVITAQSNDSETDSYFVGSDTDSETSAQKRRRLAEERLRDNEATGPLAEAPLPLPSATAALDAVRRRPAFLDPEATRPLAAAVHGIKRMPDVAPPDAAAAAGKPAKKPRPAPGEWDIASMAPPVKGAQEEEDDGLPAGAVIKAAAVRYRTDDRVMVQASTAQIAMLGGHVHDDDADEELQSSGKPRQGPRLPPAAKDPQLAARGVPTKPMGVSDFLDKGMGGALLPRKRQDRKDREKEKRSKGQSAIGSWKSEAEMVLRQQYD